MSRDSSSRKYRKIPTDPLLDNLQLARPLLGKPILMLIPQPHQLLDILLMHLVHILGIRMLILHDADRFSNDDVDRPAVGHHTHIVIEDAAGVKDGHRKAHNFLDEELEPVEQGVGLAVDLVVDVVFAEREDGDQVGAGADGHLDEALAAAEDEADDAGAGVEGLASAADDDGDGAAHAFAVVAAF